MQRKMATGNVCVGDTVPGTLGARKEHIYRLHEHRALTDGEKDEGIAQCIFREYDRPRPTFNSIGVW